MRRIIVVGPSGAGKSTLCRKLADRMELPLYHLDNLWWNPDRTHVSRDEFDRRLAELLARDQWIIDGDYARTYEPRIQACDTVIFLNYPLEVCLQGARERTGRVREDIPWADAVYDEDYDQHIISWFTEKKPRLEELLEKYREIRNIIILTSRDEADIFLAKLPEGGLT